MKQGWNIFSNRIKTFLAVAITALLFGGVWFYRDQEDSIRKSVEEDLAAIARLKADQIAAWRREQLEDAAHLQAHPFLSTSVLRFIAEASEENKRDLHARFRSLADQHALADLLLVAPDGKPLFSLAEPPEGHHGYLRALAEALRDRRPVFTELHREGPGASPHISVVVPLYAAVGPGIEPLAALVLISDASQFLYPLVQFWPTPSKTAETFLVRREGDDALFLNDLRHRPNTALKLRIPLSRTNIPAVMAVLGKEGVFQGKDYRGVEVASVILPVPDSPWFMVAKMDAAEAFAEWRFRSALMLGLLCGWVLCILATGLVVWQRDKKAHYRALYLSEASLRANVERHSITLKAIGDAVIATDAWGRVELINPRAEALTGWKQNEAYGRPVREVFHIISALTRELSEDPVAKVLREGMVVGLANHTTLISRDGTERPIADSGAPIRDEAGKVIGVVLVFRDQSAEREAQEALRKSEARYRQVLDGMLEGCQIIGFDWRYIYINDAAEGHNRRPKEELLGHRYADMWPGVEETEVFQKIRCCLEERVPAEIETFFVFPDGSSGWFDLRIEPVPEGVFILSVDITGRKVAEQELQRSTERQRFLADIIENAQQPLAVGYADGRIGVFNRAFCELTGYDREELKGIDWNEVLTPPEWRQCENEALAETVRHGKPVRYEKEYLRKDGTRVPVELLVNAIKNETGEAECYYAFVSDITQRKLEAEKMRHLNSVLRALRKINQLITHEKDQDRLLQWACEILTETRGYKSAWIGVQDSEGRPLIAFESGIGEVFTVMRAEFEQCGWLTCCRDAMDASGVIVIPDTALSCISCPLSHKYQDTAAMAGALRHAGRVFGVLIVSLPAPIADDVEEQSLFLELVGEIAFGLFSLESDRDRERAETEHKKLQTQLIQAQKMEAVGRLAGGVAHDYNNILSVIIGYSEMAMDKVGEEDPICKDLKEIHAAASRSRDITRQLLAFARKENIAPEVLDLNATVESMLKILRKLIGEDIDLAWHPGQVGWPVLMDPSQLDQILANLCVNARDAIVDIGRITIETGAATITADDCSEHPGFVSGDFVLLVVSDNGSGMDRETMDHIFEPFFTTKGLGKGTGLGLSTVYGIVKQNNGFIHVYSEPGQGTTFRIYLPRHPGEISGKKRPMDEQLVQGNGETVLVVEDEISILKLVERILSRCNYKVLSARSPSEALQAAQAHSGIISLLITDVVMPEMNGRELADQLKKLCPGVQCLFMSGYTANVIAPRGVFDEGIEFIQKPFSTRSLAAKVREVLYK